MKTTLKDWRKVHRKLERLRGLYTAIARIPAFAGLCYTQLTDVEQ